MLWVENSLVLEIQFECNKTNTAMLSINDLHRTFTFKFLLNTQNV